jgi:hypothetical protein
LRVMKSETVAIVAELAGQGGMLEIIPFRSLRAPPDLFLHASRPRYSRYNCYRPNNKLRGGWLSKSK